MTHRYACALLLLAVAIMADESLGASQRTFVRSNGSDANACSLAAPCRSFGVAISKTNPGGEVVVLDSAAYGRVTITKSVTIVAPAGVHAGISVFSGTNGIDIPTAGIVVVLRGLTISGQGGNVGIYVSGDNELTVERCDIGGMSGHGIHLDGVAGTAQIIDTVIHDNGGNGLMLFGTLSATLDRVHVDRNTATGIGVFDGVDLSIKNSALVRNYRGIDAETLTAGIITRVSADGVAVTASNHQGVQAIANTGKVKVRMTRSTIDYNFDDGVLLKSVGSGQVVGAFSDNAFNGNGSGLTIDGGSNPSATLARNTFASDDAAYAVQLVNGGAYWSGSGNTTEPGNQYQGTASTLSF